MDELTKQNSDAGAPIGVLLVSLASLLLELSLTRVFSVVLFYHFAFLAISVALLGLGAGGVFAYLKRDWLANHSTSGIAGWVCSFNAVLILIVLEVDLHVPVSLHMERGNLLRLTALYLASAVPFFLTGLLFSIVFARETGRISFLYGADLVGGSLACVAVVPLLNLVGGPNAIVCAALVMAIAGVIWAKSRRTLPAILSVLIFALLLANVHGKVIDIVYAKGKLRNQSWVLWSKWNAISRIEIDRLNAGLDYIYIDADAATAIMHVDPEHWGQNIVMDMSHGAPKVNLVASQNAVPNLYNWKRDLMSGAPSVVNVLRPNGDFAIIGPGGGIDVLRAVGNGARSVTGIEINPIIANDIMRGSRAEYSFHLYERPNVHIRVGDGRSWIRSSPDKFDVIQMTLVDTWASTAAGAFSLSENNLYTVQAFREYFDHLKPDGMLAITRWEFKNPHEALRVVSQGRKVLEDMGIRDIGGHFVVVSDGRLDQDGRPVAVLIKKSPFTDGEIDRLVAHAASTPNLNVLYVPLRNHGAEGEVVRDQPESSIPFRQLIRGDLQEAKTLIAGYPYDISSVSDDAPFFFFTLKSRDVLRSIVNHTGWGIDWNINLGIVVLGMVLVISFFAVLVFLILPLFLSGEAGQARSVPSLLYFIAVGLGFILVEITLVQRFVLFLGHPTYALTVVVFVLLMASGAGSFLSRRWMHDARRLSVALTIIMATVLVLSIALPGVLAREVGLAVPWKIALSIMLLAPLGFVMGMPFPTGLRAVSRREDSVQEVPSITAKLGVHSTGALNKPRPAIVEWAWAMNAASSVLGSVLAILVAIHFGLTVTFLCGAAAYGAAALLSRNLWQGGGTRTLKPLRQKVATA